MIRSKNTPLIDGTQFIGIVVMTIAILLVVDFGRRATTGYYVAQAEEQLKGEIAIELTRQAQLKERLDYVQSDEYVEEWAREKAHMIRPGDQPLILVASEAPIVLANATERTPPTGTPPPEPAWHRWWRLFFDTEPGISLN
ncbi:MAG: septum formation initiator family protein [Anaerolineae bacterium]|nr:septum formation initiator family protein [Anaerolineae bacterium]